MQVSEVHPLMAHNRLTPVPGVLVPSFGLHRHQAHKCYTDIQAGKNTHPDEISPLRFNPVIFFLIADRDKFIVPTTFSDMYLSIPDIFILTIFNSLLIRHNFPIFYVFFNQTQLPYFRSMLIRGILLRTVMQAGPSTLHNYQNTQNT